VAAFGEISLTGKVRYVLQGDKRIQELARRGFTRILAPSRNAEESAGAVPVGMNVQSVADVAEAVRVAAPAQRSAGSPGQVGTDGTTEARSTSG
jgi:predicted ATP-dependent serine protease